MKSNIFNRILIVLAFIILSNQVNAEIFKCESLTGEVYYHDKPCPINDKETEMRAEKDVKNGYIPPKLLKEKITKPKKRVSSATSSTVDSNKKKKDKKSQTGKQQTSRSSSNQQSSNVSNGGMPPKPLMSPERKKAAMLQGDEDDPEEENIPVLTQEEKRKFLNITPPLAK